MAARANRPGRVLLVDDDPAVRFGIRRYLERRGLEVVECGTCAEARRILANEASSFAAAILDQRLPDGTGIALLEHMAELPDAPPGLLLTGYGSIDVAVAAMRAGALDFLVKPVELATLGQRLDPVLVPAPSAEPPGQEGSAASRGERRDEKAPRRDRPPAAPGGGPSAPDPFVGSSRNLQRLAERARRLSDSKATALLLGETGSGKGVLARWLHDRSPRRDGPFVQLNCASLSRELLASELFGFRAGAFTGAQRDKPGLVEAAAGGTLFLDEIHELDPAVQPQLLTVLEEARFRRLGEVEDRHTDLRLVAASHPDLEERLRDGRFRRDLFFRISTFPLYLPPLRDRREDLPDLVAVLLRRLAGDAPLPELTPAALARLHAHDWPGNVRELRNSLERALLFCEGGPIEPEHLQLGLMDDLAGTGSEDAEGDTLMAIQIRHIERILREEDGNVARAAERLGIPRSTLYQKIKAHGLER